MKNILPALAICAFLLKTATAEEPVSFGDANLKAAVEEELWILNPTPSDMLGLTKLSYNGRQSPNAVITDLTGLQYAVNLQFLSLPSHGFSSLSPLSDMINLEHLDLRECPVSDISALSGLHRLSWLNLHKTRVRDISPLAALTALSYVDLRGTPLNLDAYEIHIPRLLAQRPDITIWYDPYRQQPCVVAVTCSGGGTVTCPGEGVFLHDYGQTVCLEAQALPGFLFVGWSGMDDDMRNPLCFSLDRDYEIRANFASVAKELCVDDDGVSDPGPDNPGVGDPYEDGTGDHPFDSIQEAVEVAMEGATIIVRPGIYREHVCLPGKGIHLAAVDPANPHAGPGVTISGLDSGCTVTIAPGNGRECSLSGFIITGGNGPAAGGIRCWGSSPTISNSLIVGNRCTDANGAAAQFSNSRAVLINCTIADNNGGTDGAALMLVDSDIVVADSIVWGNSPRGIVCRGTSDPSIRYCCIQDGWPGVGNMQTDPLFASRGSWISRVDPNAAFVSQDLLGVWRSGDYHLRSQAGRWDCAVSLWVGDEVSSPCIDGGDPTREVGHEPPPNGGIINMGAYGGTTQASKSR